MKREIVDYEVRGIKEVGDNIKQVVRKQTFEVDVDEMPILSENDYYCVTVETSDGEVIVKKSGEYVFDKDQIDEIVSDQKKVDENAEVKVHTLKKISYTNFYYDKDNKMIFNNYFNIHIANVENIPSNIAEITSKLNLLSNVYGDIWMDINDSSKIDILIKENFIIE